MDDGSPASTVERTFWTVWNYITGAVSRFFSPEPTNVVRNDPNSLQESATDSKPAKSGHTEGDAIAREVDEEQHLASVSVSSLSQAVVAWELCTTDIDLGPDEGSVQYKTQLSTGSESKEPEEDEGMRDELFGQTRSDEANTLITECTKENEEEENGVQNTHGQDEMQENDEYEEDVNSRSLSLTGDAVSKYVEESGNKAGAEEETGRVMTPDDHQKMDETMTKKEEGDVDEDKQCLEEEDIEVQLCRIKDLSLEEEGNMHIEETRMQRAEVDTALMIEEVENSDGVLLLASENENKSDEGAKQAENQPSVCEELSADHTDFMGEPILTSLHVELQMACDKSAIVSEDELIVVAQEHAMAHRGESETVEDAKKKEDESALREQGAVFQEESANEAANKQIIYEVLEQEDNIKSVTEDSQEKQISTGHVTCSEEVVQNAQTELHTTEFADGDQEDVAKDTEGQTKTETDDVETESHGEVIDVKMTATDVSVDERFFDKDKIEEERLSSEEGNKESYMEVACTTTSVTVKPEGETRQEISGEFKNISLEMCEGQLVLSQELNSPICEETQEGVPEYNNESGPDENTTQRFLEVGDWKEIPATQLPEEVESKESECLQNSGLSTDYLLVREYMEEEQDHTGDIKNSFDLVLEEHTEIVQLTEAGLPQETEKTLVEPVIQESEVLFGEEEANTLVASMKTGIEYSEKEFELDVGLTEDTDKTTKELQDGTKELLVEFEIDEGSCDSKEVDTAGDGHETTGDVAAEEVVTVETLKFLEAEVQNDREMSFFQESVDAINSDQNSYRTTSLQEVFIKSGFLEEWVESDLKLLEDSTVEMQDAGIELQEEEAAEDEVQNKNEMEISNLHVAGIAAEVTTERSEKENTLTVESLETQNQLSGEEALEVSSEETETDDKSITAESKPEDLIVISAEEMEKHVTESEQSRTEASCAEETVSSIIEHQDVIDEELLDLWLQTVSEDTDDVKQQERSEPGHQMDTEREPPNKEQGGISSAQTEKDEEQLVESNSGESELVNDTEMSSSTAESGFLDQSVGEWGTQNSETQLLKSTSTGSVQGVYDMLANMSETADISELSAPLPELNSESQDILMEGTTETRQLYLNEEESITWTEFHPDSGVTSSETRHLDEESDQSQENTDEETGLIDVDNLTRKTDWKEPEEADIKSITEMSILFKVEETKVEDEPHETTMSDSPDEIKHTEASLVEGIVSMESHSEGNICAESEETLLNLPSLDQPQPIWSEKNVDSLPGLNRVDMAEQLMTESEDQMEVDAFVLDCTAQRSRIAVKNPRVRPPKDPRSLLHMPSLEPTPSSHVPVKVPAGVPLGGLGIGIKLPGLGAGFPVLKKTQRVVRDENSQTTLPQEPETKPVETSDSPKQDEAQRKPKWMPPGHSGFGNPLMSELKNKLKKTTKE